MFKPKASSFLAEFAHTQLHSAPARAITDLVKREGLGSRISEYHVDTRGDTHDDAAPRYAGLGMPSGMQSAGTFVLRIVIWW